LARTSPYLKEIRRLDPVVDHKRITRLITCYEFPFDTTRSLELAFFRTYAVPAIGTLLDSSGEFAARAQKRYDDTDLIVSLMVEDGYDSDTGCRALRRLIRSTDAFRSRTTTSCTSSRTSSSSPFAGTTASAGAR
jgi:hypothetical protein